MLIGFAIGMSFLLLEFVSILVNVGGKPDYTVSIKDKSKDELDAQEAYRLNWVCTVGK